MKQLFDRSRQSNENIAEALLWPTVLVTGLIALVIFWNETAVKLVGGGSIGMIVLIFGAVLTLLVFTPAYLYGLKAHKEQLSNKQLVFNIISLTIASVVMTILLTTLGVGLISQSFKGLTLDRYISAVIVGVYCGLLVYVLVPAIIRLNTQGIAQIFSIVMICGMLLSMITASNPYWWQVNFSSLGSTDSPSAVAFNFTLILSGLILITLSSHLLDDITKLLKGMSTKAQNVRVGLLKKLFIFIGVCMAGVGIFTYAEHPALHNLSAYSMVIGFAIIIIGLKKILPFIDATFLANSYFTLVIIGVCYFLFAKVGYLNLTAFELLAFGITFAWLVVFIRKINSLQTTSTT